MKFLAVIQIGYRNDLGAWVSGTLNTDVATDAGRPTIGQIREIESTIAQRGGHPAKSGTLINLIELGD